MPVFELTIFKRSGLYPPPGEVWSNVYHCNSADLDGAEITADLVVTAEKPLYSPQVEITHTYIRQVGSSASRIVLNGQFGTRTDLTNILPDWNVARIDFALSGQARRARKYLRMTIQAGDVDDGVFVADVVSVLVGYGAELLDITNLCGPSGQDMNDPVVDHNVAMRQTYWSRRARPGFHRAYVPNA